MALRDANPNYELVFQEPPSKLAPEWTPVVPGTMTTLSDGTLAYLCDAGPPVRRQSSSKP